MLLEKGTKLETKDGFGQTSPLLAARNRCEAVVKLLSERGADPETNDGYVQTPLLLAVENGDEAIAKLLLEKGAMNLQHICLI